MGHVSTRFVRGASPQLNTSAIPEALFAEAAARIRAALEGIRFQRHQSSFDTYGLPAYQAQADKAEYRSEALRCNPVLLRHFSGLYRELLNRLTRHFRRRVRFHAQLAVPGLHYFTPEALNTFSGGSVHYDYSFYDIDWECRSRHVGQHYSVLAVLDAPDEGAFLEFHDEEAEPLRGHFPDLHALATVIPEHRVRLDRGTLAIFSGLTVHRIGPCHDNARQRPRITMQGHLVPCGDELILYW